MGGIYSASRRGIGEPSRERTGSRPQSGVPTGSTGVGDIPFTTPAADVYHATAAVTMPTQPPACSHHVVPPCEMLKNPITSTISVISRVRNTRKTAAFTRVAHNIMYVLKIANASRNHASPFVRFDEASAAAKFFDTSASTTMIPSPIQKPPYVENAVAPKTFRLRNSHMPARSWAAPP